MSQQAACDRKAVYYAIVDAAVEAAKDVITHDVAEDTLARCEKVALHRVRTSRGHNCIGHNCIGWTGLGRAEATGSRSTG